MFNIILCLHWHRYVHDFFIKNVLGVTSVIAHHNNFHKVVLNESLTNSQINTNVFGGSIRTMLCYE